MKPSTIKTIGIVASYLGMLVGVVWFDLRVTTIFMSFIVEVAAMSLVYAVINIILMRSPKLSLPMSVIWGAFPFLLIQLLMVGAVSYGLGETMVWDRFIYTGFDATMIVAAAVFLIVYTVRAFSALKNLNVHFSGYDNFMTQIIVLFCVNMAAFFTVFLFEFTNKLSVVIVAVSCRLALEYYLNRWDQRQTQQKI
jgi:hypothetical protein